MIEPRPPSTKPPAARWLPSAAPVTSAIPTLMALVILLGLLGACRSVDSRSESNEAAVVAADATETPDTTPPPEPTGAPEPTAAPTTQPTAEPTPTQGPEPTAAPPDSAPALSAPVLLNPKGIADIGFGADFDVVLSGVTELLGEPQEVVRNDGGGCDAFGGCELRAFWDGFQIAGGYDTNAFTFWSVETTAAMGELFTLPQNAASPQARSAPGWGLTVEGEELSYWDVYWQVRLPEVGLLGHTDYDGLAATHPEEAVAPAGVSVTRLFASDWSYAQPPPKPAPLEDHVPANWEILTQVSGQLDGDDIDDTIVVLRSIEESLPSQEVRPVLLLRGVGDGQFELVARNDRIALCAGCGGVRGDPFQQVVIEDRYFSFEHFGGSREVWFRVTTFRLNLDTDVWEVTGDTMEITDTLDPSGETEVVQLDRPAGVTFETFRYDAG